MKHKAYFWMIMQLVFLIVFLLAYSGLKTDQGFLNIMPEQTENLLLMTLSFLGIAKSVFEMLNLHK